METSFTLLQTPTPDLNQSLAFYEQLDFKIIRKDDLIYALGKSLVIQINPAPHARAGLKLVADEVVIKNYLENHAHSVTDQGYLIVSPEGCCVYLETNSVQFEENDFKQENTLLGNYNGISIESNNLKASLEFWKYLGFKVAAGTPETGWIALTNQNGFALNLMRFQMCPHLFYNPGLNFFNGKSNTGIIQELRNRKIPLTQEITHFNPGAPADNVIIRDPGGLSSFIFND